jgi:hypothetical protein
VAEKLILPIETGGIGPQKPLHPGDEVGPRGFDHQVEVVGHEAEAVDLPVGFAARLGERRHEESGVAVVAEDRFGMVAAVHQMINRPWTLDT